MRFKRSAVVILLLFTLTACTQADPTFNLITVENSTYGDYFINILIIKGESDTYLEIYQHLSSAVHANTMIKTVEHTQLKQVEDLGDFDLIYPDYGILSDENFNEQSFVTNMTAYVAQGGNLFLEHPFYQLFSEDILGVEEFIPLSLEKYQFTYPEISSSYHEIQDIYRHFISTAKTELFSDSVFDLKVGARVNSAVSLVNVNDLSIAFSNSYEHGQVTWFNRVAFNREEYITRLDFQPTSEQQSHFHFGYNSVSWLLRNKFLNIVAINKYGFALEKVMGPYTRPGLSWQNHFEEYNGFKGHDMIRFTNLLQEYQQIPSYSLVRGTYRWGKWQSSMSVHLNQNNNDEPQFTGYQPNSFYSSGERITYNNGRNIDLSLYPGYKTLLSELELPVRAYVQLADLNEDKRPDLIVGDFQGSVYCLPNVSENSTPEFTKKIELTANGSRFRHPYASPTVADLNGDGRPDIIVGEKNGYLTTYYNTGKYRFRRINSFNYGIGEYLAPHLADWNLDGVLDLVVGNAQGEVYVLTGTVQDRTTSFAQPEKILDTDLKWAAPFVYDWDNDRQLDILLGSYKGQVAIYLNQSGTLHYDQVIQGHNYTMHGNKNIDIGWSSVPYIVDWNGDGAADLVIGGLEYGAPYAIDEPSLPIRNQVLKNIEHTQDNYIPIDFHIYEHAYKTSAEQREEYQLHFKAFENLGIPSEEAGINHHTWTINADTLQALKNQQDFGVVFNFGFKPYGSIGSPRDNASFAPAIVPFQLMDGEEKREFIYWCPAPATYPQHVRSLIKYDIPLTFFEHVECRFNKRSAAYQSLIKAVEAVREYHIKGNYNFMTERQIAKSLINMYYTDLNVTINDQQLSIVPLTDNVPASAAEYHNTLGVKFVPGPSIHNVKCDALIQTNLLANQALYIGVDSETVVDLRAGELVNDRPLTILKSNVPLVISRDHEAVSIRLDSAGMQQLTVQGHKPLIIEGDDLAVTQQEHNIYTITHYGAACEITIKFE